MSLDTTLTKQQMRVARLVCAGLNNKQIARLLNLELSTVKLHVYRAMKRLKLPNRTALAVMMARQETEMPCC